MSEIWIYRSALALVFPLLIWFFRWGLNRWTTSNDNLTQAVNGIKEYISSQDVKNTIYDKAIMENDRAHRDYYKRFRDIEKDVLILQNLNPEHLNAVPQKKKR